MLAPFAPHFAEESWERLGHGASVFDGALAGLG
jgi:leucyl-tRNA synthetase